MRIALTVRNFDRRGGIGSYTYELAKRLSDRHEIHVFSTTFKSEASKKIISHKVPSFHSNIVTESIPFTLHNSIRFNLFNDFDICHGNGGEILGADVITAHSIHKAGIKFRKNNKELSGLHIHDMYALTTEFINYKLRNYKKIICDSTSSKLELIHCYNVPDEDIEVIPVGVDMNEFKYRPKDEELMRYYSLKNDDIVLLIVATEFYRKNVDKLIKSLYTLNKKGFNRLKLLIVGKARVEGNKSGDSYFRELAKSLGISDKVIFTGLIPSEKFPLFYNLADIFVFPTQYEAFGIPIIEAAASELPVITTNIAAAEHIKPEHSGLYLNNPNDIQEIADKIEYLILNPELRLQFGRNARKDVSVCSWDNVVKRTEKLYETLK